MDDNNPITVGHYPTLGEAALARNRLEAAGIAATIADDYLLTMDPLLAGATNYIKVQVRSADRDAAQSVLEAPADEIEFDEEEVADDDDDGDHDEIQSESPGERLVRLGYRAAIFGSVSLPGILHVYSLYLLLKAAIVEPRLSPKASTQFFVALLIDLGFIGLILLFVMAIFGD